MDGRTVLDGQIKFLPGAYPVENQSSDNNGTVKLSVKVTYGGVKATAYIEVNVNKIIQDYRQAAPMINQIQNSYKYGADFNPVKNELLRERWLR